MNVSWLRLRFFLSVFLVFRVLGLRWTVLETKLCFVPLILVVILNVISENFDTMMAFISDCFQGWCQCPFPILGYACQFESFYREAINTFGPLCGRMLSPQLVFEMQCQVFFCFVSNIFCWGLIPIVIMLSVLTFVICFGGVLILLSNFLQSSSSMFQT